MKPTYPLNDVIIERVAFKMEVADPKYIGENCQVNQKEFAIQFPGVGSFYARDGREVVYCTEPDADHDWVKLYLNGQVLVALLHQRKIINFHASSFIHHSRGVMVLGDTGAGKSSLTISFVLAGAGFLSDDLTPVIFREGIPYILPLDRRVKIREATAVQLNIGRERLAEAEAGTGKKYLSLGHAGVADHKLHTILRIETGDVRKPMFIQPSAAEKFSLLRGEICSWEVLAGMPETEREYLRQLVCILEQVQFVKVVRPVEIEIVALHDAVSRYLKRIDV